MATRTYTGAAASVAQVQTVTPGGTIAATDTFTLTHGSGKALTFEATTTTVAHVVTGLYDKIVASTEPEWQEIEASDEGTHLLLTGRTPGVPFTVTSSISNVSGGAAPTLTDSVTTAASGPNFWNVAANWSGAAVPTTGDTAIIEGAFNINYGLDNSGDTLARLIVRDFSGTIGLPPLNQSGYPEWREQYLKVSATILDVLHNVTSGLMRFNVGTVQTALAVYTTGSPTSPTVKALTFRGTHASNAGSILGGSVGVATEASETATFTTFGVADSQNVDVELGIGCTLTTVTQDGGNVYLWADATTVNVNGGTMYLCDDPDIATALKIRTGGTAIVNGGPTIAKVFLEGGTLDCEKDVRAFTVTDCDLYAGSTIADRFGRVTWTNAIAKKGCDFDAVTLRMGISKAVSFA